MRISLSAFAFTIAAQCISPLATSAAEVPKAIVPEAGALPLSPFATPEIEQRVDTLLRQMTLEEKIGQLNQYSSGMATGPGTGRSHYEDMIAAGKIGSLLNVVDPKVANAFQKVAIEKSRLHIPILYGYDTIHGFRTVFPVNIGLAASWDPALVEEASRLAARESAAVGIRWVFSPMVDIARDARWGRISESSGEDPYLGSALAVAYVKGYQGESLNGAGSVLACAKHFVGYGAAEGGRDYNTTEISERTLRQTYLPPFHAAAQAGAATFMAAFNSLSGVPSSFNPFTLDTVLRKEWKYKGMVVSDWGSIREGIAHGVANDMQAAAKKAFVAGVDMDMENDAYLPSLPSLIQRGEVSQDRLDEAVRRVLRLKFALGLFEKPYADTALAPEASGKQALPDASRQLARKAAEASFVLLKNDNVLPLKAKAGTKLALIGPLADSAADMLGSWSGEGRAADVITLKSALAERAEREHMTLRCAKGAGILDDDVSGISEAVELAKASDVVVLALGEKGSLTGEASSRAHLDLQGRQQQLLEAVVATGKPVALVLFNARPLTITWAAKHVPAILEAWYPGVEAGPALTRTLFGDVNPSGRLTVTFPRAVGQEPLYYNAQNTGRPPQSTVDLSKPPVAGGDRYMSRYIDELNAPLFPFGHGLSYTQFRYAPVKVEGGSLSAAALNEAGSKGAIQVSAEITNTGARPGVETAQLYIRLRGTSVSLPVRELKGFQKVSLAPGETKKVQFTLGADQLRFYGLDAHTAQVEPAKLSIWITSDSASGTPLEAEILP